jgi:glycerol-3-phosphate dehydrogenase
MPADGDILVPIWTVSVIGTTDIRAADPDELPVTQQEVDAMLDDGERLVPGLRQARALRVWAGVRPLFQDEKSGPAAADTRDVSRTHAVVDHAERDGVGRLLTMSGGKLTTMRLMAQDLVDAMCRQLGEERPSRTEHERPPGAADEYLRIGDRLRARELTLLDEQLICECELIGRGRLEEVMRTSGTTNLDDLRRRLRLGMGPCQGGFCMYRAAGILHGVDRLDGAQASASLVSFLQERWKGVWPILYGDQLREARLDDWIFHGLLDVEHLPEAEAAAVEADTEPAPV